MDTERRQVAVIAGGSGFVGRAVVQALAEDGYAIRQVGRTAAVQWDDAAALAD